MKDEISFFLFFSSLTDKKYVPLFYSHVRHACQSNKRCEHAKAMQSRFHLERCARRLIGHDHLSYDVQVSIYVSVRASITSLYRYRIKEETM